MLGNARNFAALTSPFDVIVIGGGISGVQIARESAGHGLRTLLLEMQDFGAGTSSATTKAIHGGLRYLEQREFGLVQEAINERRYLSIAAPHLVVPRRFLLTAWDWSAPGALVLGAGAALYEAMAWKRNVGVVRDRRAPRLRWIGKDELLRRAPWLDPVGLRGAWAHYDGFSLHPERLLLALLKAAVQLGTTAFNHTKVTRFITAADGPANRVRGVIVTDQLTGQEYAATGKVVVNAAGPWVESALNELAGKAGISVQQAKGVHLITRPLGNTDSIFGRARNGSHFFVSPWEGKTLIGPTDTPMDGPPDAAEATPDDIRHLLDTVNSVATRKLEPGDIESTMVGVRPLVDDGKSTYRASRRFDIHRHAERGLPGLYSVTGGKWTTARAMAEKVLEELIRSEPSLPATRRFDSRTLPVAGAFGNGPDHPSRIHGRTAHGSSMAAAFDSALTCLPELNLTREVRLHLARLYGTEHENILSLVARDPALGRRISERPERLDIAAQAVYGVLEECAKTLQDVVDRRLSLGTLGRVSAAELRHVATIVRDLLGWTDATVEGQVAGYLARQRHVQMTIAATR